MHAYHERVAETHGMERNVGETEQWISLLGGVAMAVYGLSRRSLGGLVLAAAGAPIVYRGITGYCGAYQALGINTARRRGPQNSVRARHGVRIEESQIIQKPRDELYAYFRELANLPKIMRHLRSVTESSDKRSHWVAEGPMGLTVEWDAEIITETPGELIGWRSVGDSDIDAAGSVHFETLPHDRGTKISVILKYDPPMGKLGHGVAWLAGRSPSGEIREDLKRLKALMETGTIPTTDGQPRGA
jgi:uncharacterized membrane protein